MIRGRAAVPSVKVMTDEQGRTPRWLKPTLIALGIAALVAVVALMIGGGAHGPARHFSMSGVW